MKDRQDRREHLLIPIVIPWMVNAARYHGARFNAIEYSVPSRESVSFCTNRRFDETAHFPMNFQGTPFDKLHSRCIMGYISRVL